MFSRRAEIVFGVLDAVAGALVAVGVFAGLPARWAVVDVPAGLLVALNLVAGVGLLVHARWAALAAKVAAAVSLAAGVLVVTALALTASWLAGVYGPVGRGGGLLLGLVAALALPYLVVLPAVQLAWGEPRRASR
jgi:hypothetical protein